MARPSKKTPEQKLAIVLAVLKADETAAEIARRCEVSAWPRSESFETRFALNCDFEQLILGVGSMMICRGTPEEAQSRAAVAERLESPVAFWNAI